MHLTREPARHRFRNAAAAVRLAHADRGQLRRALVRGRAEPSACRLTRPGVAREHDDPARLERPP